LNLGVKHTFLRTPGDALTIKLDFRHILCRSRAILCSGGIFPCLWVRKWLKTGNFAFLVFCAIKGAWMR